MLKVVEKEPLELIVADCGTPLSMMAMVSPRGIREPSASVPAMVTLGVP